MHLELEWEKVSWGLGKWLVNKGMRSVRGRVVTPLRSEKKSIIVAFQTCVNLDAQEVMGVFFSRHTHSFLPPPACISYTLRVPPRLEARGAVGGSGGRQQLVLGRPLNLAPRRFL